MLPHVEQGKPVKATGCVRWCSAEQSRKIILIYFLGGLFALIFGADLSAGLLFAFSGVITF